MHLAGAAERYGIHENHVIGHLPFGNLAFYEGKIAKWQVPDDVVFVDAIPLGGTGKMQKTKLREILKDYRLPGV